MTNPSDLNIQNVRTAIAREIRELQADQRDYGGHRANAVSDLERAESELSRALATDRNENRPDSASDANIRAVISSLIAANSQLGKDQHDYAGHRAAAIVDIEKAIQELRAALQSDKGS